jgi:hypothetical protein
MGKETIMKKLLLGAVFVITSLAAPVRAEEAAADEKPAPEKKAKKKAKKATKEKKDSEAEPKAE